jgi:hypothetical protein
MKKILLFLLIILGYTFSYSAPKLIIVKNDLSRIEYNLIDISNITFIGDSINRYISMFYKDSLILDEQILNIDSITIEVVNSDSSNLVIHLRNYNEVFEINKIDSVLLSSFSNTESSDLKATAKAVEEALMSSDTTKLKSLIYSNYLDFYSFDETGKEKKLSDLGEIFKTRKLIFLSYELYAIYQISYDGIDYEITFGKDDDGSWKLMNF